jgi:hypothetical protein
MKYFKFPLKYNKSNSNIFVLAESLEEIKQNLNDFKYTIVSYSNKFINNFYEFKFNGESLLYVFITNSCQSYNEIKEKGITVKIANIDTILMIYYALTFIQPPNLNINNLLVYCYLLQHIKENKFSKIGKNIKRFSLPCIGNQTSFEDLRRERDNAHKLYKKTHSKKLYNNYFFRYVPRTQNHKETRKETRKERLPRIKHSKKNIKK